MTLHFRALGVDIRGANRQEVARKGKGRTKKVKS